MKNKNKDAFHYELRNTGDTNKEYPQLWKNGALYKNYNENEYCMKGVDLSDELFDMPCASLAEGETFNIHLKSDMHNNFIAFAHPVRKGNKTIFEFFITFTTNNSEAMYLLPKHIVISKVFKRMKKFGFICKHDMYEEDWDPYDFVYKTYTHNKRTLRHLITDAITIINRLKREAEAEMAEHIKNGKIYLLNSEWQNN